MRSWVGLLSGLSLLACSASSPEAGPTGPNNASFSAPLERRVTPRPSIRPAVRPDELVLDLDATRTLVARPMEAPDHADPPFGATVTLWESAPDVRRMPWHFDGVTIGHAALLPGGGLAVIDAEGRLLHLDAPTATPRLIADRVTGPIGVSPDGDRITFARGEMPDFELHEVKLTGGEARPVTRGLAPVWCGAPGRKPGTHVFASGFGGDASTWLALPGEAPRRLPGVPFPSGLVAPDARLLHGEDVFVHETEGGIAIVDARGTLVLSIPVGRAPFLHPDGTLEYLTSTGWRRATAATRGVTP